MDPYGVLPGNRGVVPIPVLTGISEGSLGDVTYHLVLKDKQASCSLQRVENIPSREVAAVQVSPLQGLHSRAVVGSQEEQGAQL